MRAEARESRRKRDGRKKVEEEKRVEEGEDSAGKESGRNGAEKAEKV